jgi:glycosyltransferase involved in cell wall biosynthesis
MFGKKARFEVVYNSIYTSKWKFNPLERIKIRNKLNIKNDKKVIVSVARLDTQKNSIRLIKILATLFKIDNTFCAVLVGDGPLRSEIESKIAEAGMTDKIMLLGMQKNVAPLLWASDIFILPSLFEGLPFVIVEAQAAGLPSIVSDGVIPSVADVTDQVFSINLSASDTEWSDLIRQISLTSDSDRLEMNQLVRDSRFSIEAFTQQITRIFASLKEEDGQNG